MQSSTRTKMHLSVAPHLTNTLSVCQAWFNKCNGEESKSLFTDELHVNKKFTVLWLLHVRVSPNFLL